ncbi:MAG: murein biosynthesis integral membrane protein MurJ [Chloroflexi bacterium]|nr:murein biosynthesis integral membrane protein MurJ [Chloroflexota bacterium]
MESTEPKVTEHKPHISIGRVLSFATITAFGFLLGKVSGIVREIVVSAQYGLSSDLDAYFVAGTVPTIINNIIAGSAITAAMMPVFARYLSKDARADFWYVGSLVTNILLVITGIITLIAVVFASPIIGFVGSGFPPETQALAAQLLVIMMPTLVLGALLNMLMAMLNSLDRFTAPALIFLALNVGIIVTVVVLTPIIGIYAVAWGFLIGVALQVAIQFVELGLERPQFHWSLNWRHPAIGQVLRALVPITALSIVAQINLLVDRTMATGLPEGSVSALYYADSVLGLFYTLGTSLSIGAFPMLSRLAADNDLENSGRTITTSVRLLIFILMPVTFLLFPFAVPTIGLILGRGKFDPSAVDLTAQALMMYAIGLIAIAVVYFLQRAFYAMADNVTPFIVGVGTMILHILLNLALIPSMAHAGIALSASISTIIGAIVLTTLLAHRIPKIDGVSLIGYSIRCAIISVMCLIPVVWIFSVMQLDSETLNARVVGVAFLGIGVLLYLVLSLALQVPESQMLMRVLQGFWRRKAAE